mmetsp:Transcript_14620/g.25264  ORF Transcript_14620/g.25264 Transcript_14620/m.25264 type:complete len:204 (-) Transcript_14620:712-1323(-)
MRKIHNALCGAQCVENKIYMAMNNGCQVLILGMIINVDLVFRNKLGGLAQLLHTINHLTSNTFLDQLVILLNVQDDQNARRAARMHGFKATPLINLWLNLTSDLDVLHTDKVPFKLHASLGFDFEHLLRRHGFQSLIHGTERFTERLTQDASIPLSLQQDIFVLLGGVVDLPHVELALDIVFQLLDRIKYVLFRMDYSHALEW